MTTDATNPTTNPSREALRARAIEIAREHAKAKPQSYYAEPFQPHEWVIDAIVSALAAPEPGGRVEEAVSQLRTLADDMARANINGFGNRATLIADRLAAPEPVGRVDMPEELFDAHAVYRELSDYQRRRTGPENVSDVLGVVAVLIHRRLAAPTGKENES